MTGNGDYNAKNDNYGDSVVKLKSDLTEVLDYFTPHDQQDLNSHDLDLGSGGLLLALDNESGDLCIGWGKESKLYVMDCNGLRGYHQKSDAVKLIMTVGPANDDYHIQGSPTLLPGSDGQSLVHLWAMRDYLKVYTLDKGQLSLQNQFLNTDPDNVPGGNDGESGGFLTLSCNGLESGTAILTQGSRKNRSREYCVHSIPFR